MTGMGIPDVKLLKNLNSSVFQNDPNRRTLPALIKDLKQRPTREYYMQSVDNLTDNDLMGILNSVYRKSSSSYFTNSEDQLLDASIILVCLRSLLKKWDGFPKLFVTENDEKTIIDALRKFLKYNLDHVFLKKDEVLEKIKENEKGINTQINEASLREALYGEKPNSVSKYNGRCQSIDIKCPYSKLKTLFVMDADHDDTTILNDAEDQKAIESEFQLADFQFSSLCNWLFVGIVFNTSEFKVVFKNSHILSYKLIKYGESYKPIVDDPVSCYANVSLEEDKYVILQTKEFSSYLLTATEFRENATVDKEELRKCAIRLGETIQGMGPIMKTATEYNIPGKKPYVRYLGQIKDLKSGGPIISHDKQMYVNELCEVNVRLQEIIYPKVTISVFKNSNVDSKKTTTMELKCLICDVSFQSAKASRDLKRHLILEHGQEPDWFCAECERSFTMKKLTTNNWKHLCPGKPRELWKNYGKV